MTDAGRERGPDEGGKPMITQKISLYEDRTDVSLTAYLWDDSAEIGLGLKRPAVLICPGGAYLSCADTEGEPVALRFAAMGYQAFVLRYSTYMKGKNPALNFGRKLSPQPETAHPVPVREIGRAMLLIRQHAGEWRVDADRVAVCGFSAGAHNAAMYATNWHRPVITEALGVEKEMLRPAAAILGYPLTDYLFMRDATAGNEFDRDFFANSVIAFLGTDSPTSEQLAAVSPARLVDENTPPMFIWATAADNMVPVTHSLLMAQALSANKIPYTLHIFEEGPHGLSTGTQASAASLMQISEEVQPWLPMAEKWLMKRFALRLPEMTAFERMMKESERTDNHAR